MSPVLDQTAWRVDALSLLWEELDTYAFPPISLLSQVVSKVVDQVLLRDDSDCPRMAKHALVPGSGQPVGSSSTIATQGEIC